MNDSVQLISLPNLSLALVPAFIVIVILWRWQLNYRNSLYAIFRMLVQLLLIGYLLTYIFQANSSLVVLLVLAVMLFSSSWIALRVVDLPVGDLYLKSFSAILVGGGITLAFTSQAVLQLQPWFMPNYLIPLAGMVFANAMNSVSLAGERLQAELDNGNDYQRAKTIAFNASMIPVVNGLFAVGLVSLPGMMTGQILSGVSPLVAVRYQIMVMCMIFASSGISSALFLALLRSRFSTD